MRKPGKRGSPDKLSHPSGHAFRAQTGDISKNLYKSDRGGSKYLNGKVLEPTVERKVINYRKDEEINRNDLRTLIENRKRINEAGDLESRAEKEVPKRQRLKKIAFSKRKVHALQRAREKRRKILTKRMLASASAAANGGRRELPVSPLIIFGGIINGCPASILKDDGCNTNVISRSFYERHRMDFPVTEQADIVIQHSSQEASEAGSRILKDVSVKIGPHTYKSAFVVDDCRYDVLLGMPWHVENKPLVDYKNQRVRIGDLVLAAPPEAEASLRVQHISVKKFRKICRRQRGALFCLRINSLLKEERPSDGRKEIRDPELRSIVEEYKDVFRAELPRGLPPMRNVEHEIIIDPDSKIPFRRLYQLSSQEQEAAREDRKSVV